MMQGIYQNYCKRYIEKTLNKKKYFFYNNSTQLQMGPKVILLGGELIKNIFSQGKPLEFHPWVKNSILMPAVGFEPTTSQSHSGGVNT